MSTRFLVIDKKMGETPLQALRACQKSHPELMEKPMTYAGRLDPMAEGKLILLIGDECKKRADYTNLDKEYEFEILLGASTDTGDVLGLPTVVGPHSAEEAQLRQLAADFIGNYKLPYPVFSSKTVSGKALFEHALSGTIKEIEIPSKEISIFKMQYISSRNLSRDILFRDIREKINRIVIDPHDDRPGSDFRKAEVLKRWGLPEILKEGIYTIVRFRAVVSSGTYIRSLAPLVAERLGTSGLAYSIRRTKIGRYRSFFARFGFWTASF